MKQYLLIDIGGTFIKYSLADEQVRKISGGKVPTPLTNMDDLLAAIEGFAAPLQGQFVGCAISMPGRIDTRNGIAHTGGMLSAFMWEQPFAAQVEARLGVPVTIANDGKCAAAAEGWTGALAGVENGLVLVLGTGIGGGIILNGKVLMGAHAAAGEVSGLVSDISKMADDDFKLTSVERYSEAPLWSGMASASGLILEYARQKHLPTGSPMPTGEEIFAAYNAGEPEAQKALKIFARRVAVGILSLQNVLDVEKVAIGGGISAAAAGPAMAFMGMNQAAAAGGVNARDLYQMGGQQTAAQPQAAPAAGWTCSCGHTGNTGKFCAECGKPRPEAPAVWVCSCGAKNSGKFCSECGRPRPAAKCANCGFVPADPANPPKFCPECGKPFGA